VEVFVQKKSKKTKKATRFTPELVINQKINNGWIGGRRNMVAGSVSERRQAKMGSEILTEKPGSVPLHDGQVARGMIEKKKNLINKHSNKHKGISSFGN
jgi:hypothetical protein